MDKTACNSNFVIMIILISCKKSVLISNDFTIGVCPANACHSVVGCRKHQLDDFSECLVIPACITPISMNEQSDKVLHHLVQFSPCPRVENGCQYSFSYFSNQEIMTGCLNAKRSTYCTNRRFCGLGSKKLPNIIYLL